MSGYPRQVLAALFDAVELNDVVDPVVRLPQPLPLACDAAQIQRCLALCLQFWEEGADREQLLALTATLLRTGDLSADARRRYKLIRARYKQLRFALVLYGAQHRVPPLLRATVVALGRLQDAFKLGRRRAVTRYALVLRMLLSRPVWFAVRREIAAVKIDDAEGFLRFRKSEIGCLRRWLAEPRLTAHGFHAMRKIISRQVSFYDTLRSLEPDDGYLGMSRYLSAINGLMGSHHDDLVDETFSGRRDYHRDAVTLSGDVRARLQALVAAYPREAAAARGGAKSALSLRARRAVVKTSGADRGVD